VTDQTKESTHRIVVGVDGSESSLGALEWAANEATLTGSTLEAVTSWIWPNTYANAFYLSDLYDPAAEAHKVLDDAIERVQSAYPDVTIRPIVVEGHPAPALVGASLGADLLVVGSRGRGEFSGMLLGSVSEYCTHNVGCPITIVR